MKVIINAASAKMGGTVNYVTHLLRNLAALPGSAEYVVFLPPETSDKQGQLPSKIRLCPVRVGYVNWFRRLWWEQVTLRRFLRKEKADVLFSTGNFGMLGCPARQVVLVRNAIYFSRLYQEAFGRRHSFGAKIAFKLRRLSPAGRSYTISRRGA